MSELYQDNSDELIQSLSYKNPSTASYIISRNSSTFHPVGGNVYSTSSGARLIKFYLTGEDFLDPQSLRVQFDIKNNDSVATEILYPIGGPHGFFSRCRCLARGQVIDDITDFNRVSEMFTLLKSEGSAQNDMLESINHYGLRGKPTTQQLQGIPGGTYRTVLFKPLIGLLNQSKYISLKYVPLTIELELDTDNLANIVKPGVEGTGADDKYKTAVTTDKWEITNPLIRCDIVKVDSELQNKYDDHFASGGAINIKYTTYHSQILTIPSSSGPFSLNVSRSLTYLTRVFVSFIRAVGTGGNTEQYWNKKFNCFYHTLRIYNHPSDVVAPIYIQNEDIVQSAQIQIGSKLIPDYPVTSSAEAFYFLRKALNTDSVFPSHIHSVNISGQDYVDSKFVMCFDCEKLNGKTASFSGMNIKNGEQITLKMIFPTSTNIYNPTDCHIILESEQVLEVNGSYVRVAD